MLRNACNEFIPSHPSTIPYYIVQAFVEITGMGGNMGLLRASKRVLYSSSLLPLLSEKKFFSPHFERFRNILFHFLVCILES
jgi:hypothetical protein